MITKQFLQKFTGKYDFACGKHSRVNWEYKNGMLKVRYMPTDRKMLLVVTTPLSDTDLDICELHPVALPEVIQFSPKELQLALADAGTQFSMFVKGRNLVLKCGLKEYKVWLTTDGDLIPLLKTVNFTNNIYTLSQKDIGWLIEYCRNEINQYASIPKAEKEYESCHAISVGDVFADAKGLWFDCPSIYNLLKANKDARSTTARVNKTGLLRFVFKDGIITSAYYLIKADRPDYTINEA